MTKRQKKKKAMNPFAHEEFSWTLSFGRQLILQKGAKVKMTQQLISITFTTSLDAFLDHFAVFTQK